MTPPPQLGCLPTVERLTTPTRSGCLFDRIAGGDLSLRPSSIPGCNSGAGSPPLAGLWHPCLFGCAIFHRPFDLPGKVRNSALPDGASSIIPDCCGHTTSQRHLNFLKDSPWIGERMSHLAEPCRRFRNDLTVTSAQGLSIQQWSFAVSCNLSVRVGLPMIVPLQESCFPAKLVVV